MEEKNDLIHSFPFLSIRRNEVYPVFTNASTDDAIPWPDRLDDETSGQVNAWFRWSVEEDSAERFSVSLRLLRPEEWNTRFEIPEKAVADVLIRRLQKFSLRPGETFCWQYGERTGSGTADAGGHPFADGLTVTCEAEVLTFRRA